VGPPRRRPGDAGRRDARVGRPGGQHLSHQLRGQMRRALVPLFLLLPAACATGSKPCHEGGDVSWEWKGEPSKGNRQCLQHKDKAGRWVNHGRYVVWFPDGEVALEGNFKEGLKEGKWVQYDRTGKKILEKEFEGGTEIKDFADSKKAAPPPREPAP